MKFKAIVKVKLAESYLGLECEEREKYEEARNDGETAKAIWGDEFISYKVEEV